tara:strand:+ start:1337 stop:1900 length:564 start_codon:yes stop_codon:yes gene_type:complete
MTINLFSQNTEREKQFFPINISVIHESISLPFVTNPIKYQYNPAFLIGTEYMLKKKNKHDFHLSGNLGYYYHKDWESTPFVEIRVGYEYFIKRFSIGTDFGIGYAHIFNPKPVYGFEDGKFQEVKNKGTSAFQSSFSILPSFKLHQKDNSSELFFAYTFAIQYPFSETKGFHQFIGIGYKFYPIKNK